ncbi:MAG: type I restriction endonuclease subunit R, partial [Romboutsia sp.]|nr:type I restriction endonuclease subunit R [Romboutsia sp.]
MPYQSEFELENLLIEQLTSQGYDEIVIKNEQQLKENLRHQLFLYNKEKLNNIPFTDKEFERVLTHLEGKTVFDSAKILRDKFLLEREDGTKVYIEFLNQKLWCKNKYQVTHQITVKGKYENRYDVTLLINGLPLVQIELKRRGLEMKEAFSQILRYKKHSYSGLFKYVQIFVISNGVDTKYFANSDKNLMYSQTFFWSDDKNNIITQLNDFAYEFLDKCFISEIISRYMVVNDYAKTLMVMRPYQIYAVKRAYNRVIETNKNGYIWHTTGSGKTLTSFKLSQLL